MVSEIRGKYRVQVGFKEEEYELLRWFAYQRHLTVNELVRQVVLEVARDLKVNG